jgi:hypothetical protein
VSPRRTPATRRPKVPAVSVLDEAAHELYGVAPSRFVAARDERVKAARARGDPELASELQQLRKPTAGAWLANLLVRERQEDVTRLLDLARALRDAQSRLAGAELRRLSLQRHELLAALGREGVELARAAGQRVTEAHVADLQHTLEAALADPDAAHALAEGRLTTALRYSGLGFAGAGLFGAAPVERREPATRHGTPKTRASKAGATSRGAAPASGTRRAPASRRATTVGRATGSAAIGRARGDARAARREVQAAEREVVDTDRSLGRARDDLARATAQVAASRAAVADAERRARAARTARDAAVKAAVATERALQRLQGSG